MISDPIPFSLFLQGIDAYGQRLTEISAMREVVHCRFAVWGPDSPHEIIELDSDLSMSVRFRRTKIFGAHLR